MTKHMVVILVSIAVLSVITAQAAAPQGMPAAGKTVLDGAYSEAQAARGQAEYVKTCSQCHGDNLQGYAGGYNGGGGNASSLVGPGFIDDWREDNLVELYTLIRTGMPRQNVTAASDAAKIDVLAYILQKNGFPAGTAELSADTLKSTQLVGKDGPKALPSETTVWTVGCLTKGPDNAWSLTKAAEPQRTRRPDETSPEDLKSAEAKALGNLSFKLPSLDYAVPGVKPTPLRGHKVQIKGLVYRQPDNDRISVKSLKSIATSCSS